MKKKFIKHLIFAIICSNISIAVIIENYVGRNTNIFIWVASISFFIILVTFFMTSKFFKEYFIDKIDKINKGLKMIEQGNYDYHLEIDSSDELGQIFDNINKMKEKIKNRQKDLLTHQKQIHYLAYYDQLTGLPNKALFEEQLSKSLKKAKKAEQKIALLFLDLDHFKTVNDTIGHIFGDLLLKNVAKLLKKYVDEYDMIARLGGDEFVIIMKDVENKEKINNMVKKIVKAFQNPWMIDDREFYITVSIGVTIFPDDGEDTYSLLKNADAAMHHIKENGKNNYHFYTSTMNQRMLETLELGNDLRHAIERDEFLLYYQPKIDISNRKVTGVEALIRWKHPHKGLVPPNHFIPLAEEMGLIIQVGDWVIKTACKQIALWSLQGYKDIRVAVNLSVMQLQQPDFVDRVKEILEETGIEPKYLELEITENIIMSEFKFTNKRLYDLRKLGIHIALDDFGKGYSSLNYLKQLEIDVLKIDKTFIDDILKNQNEQAIVKAVVDMAHSMKLDVVAEGVETWDQFEYLKKLYCDKVQGYLFSKPLSAMEFEEYIQKDRIAI